MTLRTVYNIICSFDKLIIVYFAISILIARIYHDPIVIIVLSSLSIILIPLIVGKSVTSIILKNRIDDKTPISLVAAEWFIGNLFIYYSASLLSFAKILEPRVYSFSLIVLPTIYINIYNVRKNKIKLKNSLNVFIKKSFGSKLVIPLIILAGLLPLFYLLPIQPFPLSPTQSWVRIRLSMKFINEGYVELVRGYSHWISVIISPVAIIYDFHPLEILSATNYICHIIYPFALYLITYVLTQDVIISLVPTFLGPWIFLLGNLNLTTLENTPLVFFIFVWMIYIALDYYHKKPLIVKDIDLKSFLLSSLIIILSPITYVIGKGGRVIPPNYFVLLSLLIPIIIIFIYYKLNKINRGRIELLLIFVFPLTLAAIAHPYLGSMVVVFLGCFFLSLYISNKHPKKLIIFSVLLLITPILISSIVNFTSNFVLTKWLVGNILQGTSLDINVQEKWLRFLSEGPELAVYLFFASIVLIITKGCRKYIPFVFISSLLLSVTFFPEGLFWRVVAYLNPLAAVMISYLLIFPLTILEKKVTKYSKIVLNYQKKNFTISSNLLLVATKLLFFAIILVLILPTAQSVRMQYFENFARYSGEGYNSWVYTYDVNTSFWFLNNFKNEEILIISDPATMFFIGTITSKDTLLFEYVEYYPSEYLPATWIHMEQLKKVFFSLGVPGTNERMQDVISKFSEYDYYNYLKNNYSKIFFVVTPRTYSWLYENVTLPITVKNIAIDSSNIISRLDNDNDFNLVYEIVRSLYVYELTMVD